MRFGHRGRLGVAVGLLGLASATLWSVSRFAEGGILDHRIHDYYRSRVSHQRRALERPGRGTFMRPYGPEVLLTLSENKLLEGYQGQDLSVKNPVSRFEVAFLIGRFIRQLNSRDGRIFGRDQSTDHQAMWVPQVGWGLFEVEDALSEKILRPVWERGWWLRPVTRYQMAIEVGRLLERLAPHYELITFFEVYPPDGYDEFPAAGHPSWYLSKPAIVHGVMNDVNGRFRGLDPVSTHEMAEIVDRLLGIVNGYRRAPARPLPAMVPDGSDDAFPRPDPFPEAQRTLRHHVREIETEEHGETIYQRPTFGDEPRDRRDDL